MGSVCGSTLSLLDAGVPLKAPVNGTARVSLKKAKKLESLQIFKGLRISLVTWILKSLVRKGITALQMDMKITGLPVSVISDAIKKLIPQDYIF